jgi:hypothetical protein
MYTNAMNSMGDLLRCLIGMGIGMIAIFLIGTEIRSKYPSEIQNYGIREPLPKGCIITLLVLVLAGLLIALY